jgi:DNA-binding IclR family transcriptional regulator
MRTPIQVRDTALEELSELATLHRQTKDVRMRERTQIILLETEQGMTAPEITRILRRNDQTV